MMNYTPFFTKRIRLALIALAVIAVLVLIAGAGLLAAYWPFSEAKVTKSLQETFPATVTFQKFHSTFFPNPGCVADGIVFQRLGRPPGTPPIVTIQHLSIQARYTDIFFRPGYLAHIVINGFRVQVPPIGTPLANTGWTSTPSTTRIGEIFADGATVEIARQSPQPSLRFDIHTLKLTSVTHNQPLSYAVSLHNPLPPGEIRAQGKFGPWNSDSPGQTLVDGEYTFQNADLSVFKGISGILFAKDKFQGTLQRMQTHGHIDIPDFMVTQSEHSVHLTAEYRVLVNGTNGDVTLQSVSAAYLHTTVQAQGEVAGHRGQDGKITSLDLSVRDGRIEDVLRLFVRSKDPPLNGATNFNAHVIIPPDLHPFLRKVRFTADFGIAGGEFAKDSTQTKVDALSERARGQKPDENPAAQNQESVISNLAGHVELRDAVANFHDLSFTVPGAFARMHGTYNLENKGIDLHGTLKTEVEFSQMTSGFKSTLLKPFNSFFKTKHAGADLPVHVIGNYSHPQFGLDLPLKPSADNKASAVGAAQPAPATVTLN